MIPSSTSLNPHIPKDRQARLYSEDLIANRNESCQCVFQFCSMLTLDLITVLYTMYLHSCKLEVTPCIPSVNLEGGPLLTCEQISKKKYQEVNWWLFVVLFAILIVNIHKKLQKYYPGY